MTNTNQNFDQLKALNERLLAKETRLSEKLAEVRKQREAVMTTLALLGGEEKDIEEPPAPLVQPRELRNLTQLDALIHIANRNNGRVKIREAKALLSRASLLNGNPKDWYNILFTIIKRSEKFAHVGPGEYELLQDDNQGQVLPMRRTVA